MARQITLAVITASVLLRFQLLRLLRELKQTTVVIKEDAREFPKKKLFINWEYLDGAAELLNRFPRTSQLTRVGANKIPQLNTQPLNDFIECQINISDFTVDSRASLDPIRHTTDIRCCTNDILKRDKKKSPKKSASPSKKCCEPLPISK